MDHMAGKRAAVGSGAGPIGTAAQGTRGSPAPAFRRNTTVPGGNPAVLRRKRRLAPAETPQGSGGNVRRPPGGKHHGLLGETHGTRPETCGGHTGNAQCPPGVNAAGYGPPDSKAAGHWPFRRNAQQAGGSPLNACRVAWRASVPDFTPLSPGRTRQFAGGGRDSTWAGGRAVERPSRPGGPD